jgi:hypothetical protein
MLINLWFQHHHLHGLGPMACSGSIVHRKTFLFSIRRYIIELSSNKNVLQKRYQRLVEWDGDKAAVFWSTITAIVCINPSEGVPRPPSEMFRRWGLHPITLGKGPPYLWPLEKGGPAIIKPPDSGLPVRPRILTLVFGSPQHICWDPPPPHPPTGERARWGYRAPTRDDVNKQNIYLRQRVQNY